MTIDVTSGPWLPEPCTTPEPVTRPRSVLIVGAGLGGYHLAYQLRRQGFTGEVTVLGDEARPPYDRPPLSKGFLAGKVSAEQLALDPQDAPLAARWVRGAAADHLGLADTVDGRQWSVRTTDGQRWEADAVVVATGARPMRLTGPATGVHVLRTMDDAEALRTDGITGRRVVVVGGGFIGLETAATAAGLDATDVTLVCATDQPLSERYGPVVAGSLEGLHRRNGVRIHGGVQVSRLRHDTDGRVCAVELSDGVLIDTDLVVLGIGARPATGWLSGHEGAGRLAFNPSGAVLCDSAGRTGLGSLWAIGDCSQWAFADGSGYRRTGHWQDALDQAAVVAGDLLGQSAPALPEPYLWSDQHGVLIQVAGHLLGDEEAVVRAGTVDGHDLLVTYHRDGVEVGVLGMNRQREVTRWRRSRRTGSRHQPAA